MYDNEIAVPGMADTQEHERHPPSSADDEEIGTIVENPGNSPTVIPKPVFMRLLLLFGGGIGCLLVGVVVFIVTRDLALFAMSTILSVAFVAKGFLLKRKINSGHLFCVSGVCVSIVPKILGRYRRIELVDTDTGDEMHFILPKKVIFKVGHVYNCYFDNQITNRPVSINNSKGVFFSADMDLPTNGFLGFEDFGVYQEKPVTAKPVISTNENPPDGVDKSSINDKEERP